MKSKKYDNLAKIYDLIDLPLEWKISKFRKKLLKGLHGKVLEIGLGTGKNLKHYPSDVSLDAVDASQGMLSIAEKRNKDARLHRMDAEKLSFNDNSFDAVVCTLSLCSIEKPLNALREMKRVMKKNGKILLIEHVRSRNKAISFFQKIASPVWKLMFGCSLDRDTGKSIEKVGLSIESEKSIFLGDVFRVFICRK
ncbi:class I SAM-dependent methyltransferase [Candidatus Woesearchaeota archaeon]|nr:class I SAM-dependent methyltransferase [Candidatus Woesearchaeota archaeon]